MSEDNKIADRLSALHGRLISQFSLYTEKDLRTQYHPDLSQLGWHLSHIAFIEQYWLREKVLGDDLNVDVYLILQTSNSCILTFQMLKNYGLSCHLDDMSTNC